MMDKKQIEKIRLQLLENKDALEESSKANEGAVDTVELDQTRQGRLSRMDALQGQAMSIAALNRRSMEIKKIDQALSRIEQNHFGICQICDKAISYQRLALSPTVTHCIDCAEKLEG